MADLTPDDNSREMEIRVVQADNEQTSEERRTIRRLNTEGKQQSE